jgi:hypothetical protein
MQQRPVAMLDKGHGIKTTARSLGVSVSTLRRRLREAGEWPRQPARINGVQNPPAQVWADAGSVGGPERGSTRKWIQLPARPDPSPPRSQGSRRRPPLSGEPDGGGGVFGATHPKVGCARWHPKMDRSLARERPP